MTDSPECNSFGYCPDRMARLAIRSAISLSRKVDFLCKTIVIWVLSNDQPISSLPEILWNLNQSLSAKWTLCTQATGNCTHSRIIALKIRKWTDLILRADRQWYDTLSAFDATMAFDIPRARANIGYLLWCSHLRGIDEEHHLRFLPEMSRSRRRWKLLSPLL